MAKLNRVLEDSSVLVGDVLRGFTCTNFVYRTQALFGAQAPQRTLVLYGADKQKWPQVSHASFVHVMLQVFNVCTLWPVDMSILCTVEGHERIC